MMRSGITRPPGSGPTAVLRPDIFVIDFYTLMSDSDISKRRWLQFFCDCRAPRTASATPVSVGLHAVGGGDDAVAGDEQAGHLPHLAVGRAHALAVVRRRPCGSSPGSAARRRAASRTDGRRAARRPPCRDGRSPALARSITSWSRAREAVVHASSRASRTRRRRRRRTPPGPTPAGPSRRTGRAPRWSREPPGRPRRASPGDASSCITWPWKGISSVKGTQVTPLYSLSRAAARLPRPASSGTSRGCARRRRSAPGR